MNGKAAKRIRWAAKAANRHVGAGRLNEKRLAKELKDDYKARPYHTREQLFPKHSHRQRIAMRRETYKLITARETTE